MKQYKILNEDINENELMQLWYRDLRTYPTLVWISMYYVEKINAIRSMTTVQRIIVPGYAWRDIETSNIHCEYLSPDGELKKHKYGKYDYPLIYIRKF